MGRRMARASDAFQKTKWATWKATQLFDPPSERLFCHYKGFVFFRRKDVTKPLEAAARSTTLVRLSPDEP